MNMHRSAPSRTRSHRTPFGIALLLVVLSLMVPRSAMAQEPTSDLDVVELSTDGDQVTMTVVAPPGLRGSEVGVGSFVVHIGDESLIPSVERIAGEELDVVLLVDVSGSMALEALEAAKSSGAAFVNQLPTNTRVAVVSFGDVATLVQPFTSTPSEVISTLNGLEAAGETALHAAVVTAAQQFDPTRDSVRTIVLLSDGGNTVELSSLGNAQAALQASGATLHAISIETDERNDAELEALAEASNGTVGRVEQIEALEHLQQAIAVNLGNQYRLRFTATAEGSQTAQVQARLGDTIVAETLLTVALPVAPLVVAVPTTAAITPPIEQAAPTVPTASPPTIAEAHAGANLLLKWLSIGAIALAIAAIGLVLMIPGQRTTKRAKPAQQFKMPRRVGAGKGFRWLAAKIADAGEGVFNRVPLGLRIAKLLDAAGWKVRTSEFMVLTLLGAGGGFLVGAVKSLQFGLVAAGMVVLLVTGALTMTVKRRQGAFADQLTPGLQMLAGALRTGYSLPQAINLVAKEAEAPLGEEFSRVSVEVRLGRDLVEALQSVSTRMNNADFAWTTGAIDIARDVGGDLAGVLDNVGETVRTRERISRQIYSLSAEGRISAYILIILPFPMFFWQLMVNRDYTGLLFTDPLGQVFLVGGITLLVFGALWLRRLIRIDY